ncbi:MAG TPA: FGGY-family carbohydrate kinase [Bacteroidales bacterium]|nr:FGGY-family carbohydrate kinase [Bacteroidales bacterium]
MKNIFNCIAIDMGASSVRVMLGTVTKEKISYKEIRRINNEIKVIDGHERWDIENIFSAITNAVSQEIISGKTEVTSIGVDSWGVDFVLLDKNRKLIELPVSYRDIRTEGMEQEWKALMSGKETFKRTGINFYPFNTLLQLFSIKNSNLLKKAETLLFIPGFISWKLSGIAYNETTIACTSQVFGAGNPVPDKKILSLLNLKPGLFGKIIPPGRKTGKVLPSTGFPEEMEVIAVCGHDTASAIAAIPAENDHFTYIATGTWCITGIVTNEPVLTDEAFREGFTNERGYDNTYRFLKNIVGLWLIQRLRSSMEKEYSFQEIESLVSDSDYTGLVYPDNEIFYNPANMKLAFDEYYNLTNQILPTGPADYFKSAYNSLCCSLRFNLELAESLSGSEANTVHMIGGGCRSEYLCRQTANLTGRKIIAGPVESAAAGNIIVQAIAMGALKDISEGRKLVKASYPVKEYMPAKEINVANLYRKFLMIRG